MLWRAVPSNVYDPSRHHFRVTTVDENVANLRRIVELIRSHVPQASIVFTLSPVPLAATFRGGQLRDGQFGLEGHSARGRG